MVGIRTRGVNMEGFHIYPAIEKYSSFKEFVEYYGIGKNDLVITSSYIEKNYLKDNINSIVISYDDFIHGEPTDVGFTKMAESIASLSYDRVFGIGGGSVLDVAKLFALKKNLPVVDLFEKKFLAKKSKELYLVPTTCGTGSEVTNISILALTTRNTKFGLASNALYADSAILISEMLTNLPLGVFATSSIDALVHAIESFMSPKANAYTEMFSINAMTLILNVYKDIYSKEDKMAWKNHLDDLMIASNYAGIAFGNAGCAAVHALSYPLGASYHVAHGESNYAMFTGVFRKYIEKKPKGKIELLDNLLKSILETDNDVYEELEIILNYVLPKKKLSEYGMKEIEINEFADSVLSKQTRLLANNYVELTKEDIVDIYTRLY